MMQERFASDAASKPVPVRMALLGCGIGHSLSPVLYQAGYAYLGIQGSYECFDCARDTLVRDFLQDEGAGSGFHALNFTTPYKQLAFGESAVQAASAKLAQGANLLVRRKGRWLALNTDGQGFVEAAQRVGCDFAGKRVVVCGTGSTALSIAHACALAGSAAILLLSRNQKRASDVQRAFEQRFSQLAHATVDLGSKTAGERSLAQAQRLTKIAANTYDQAQAALGAADIVVNATPLGLNAGDLSPCNTALLRPGQWAFDCVYGHGETAFVQGVRRAGCIVHDGRGMLACQAAANLLAVCDIAGIPVPSDPCLQDRLTDALFAALF